MSWNDCLYQYHQTHGGQFWAGSEDDALLVLPWRERSLAVDLSTVSAGRSGTASYVRARLPVHLGKPYKLTIGAETVLSGGVNTVLRAIPGLPELSALPSDFGYPEVTKKRFIRSDNHSFTKLVLGNLGFRDALLACPWDKVSICPGPGQEGLHLITVSTAASVNGFANGGGDWYLDPPPAPLAGEERAQEAQRMEEAFFSRMDRFLELARTACGAVTQWTL